MKRMIDQTGTVLTALVVTVLFALCLSFVYLRFAGLSPLVVTGGSMEPNIHKGALVLVEPVAPSTVRVGDVITFSHYDQLTTHRVIAMESTNAGLTFKTKGDANTVADPDPMLFPDRVGIVRGSVPAIGFAVAYVQYYWRIALMLVTASVFFGCAGMLVFRRDDPASRLASAGRALRPAVARIRPVDADAIWSAHLQWVGQSTRQRIRVA